MADPFDPFHKAMEQVLKDLTKAINMRSLGREAAEMIRLRTRLGYGVASDAKPRRKLKPLSSSYKAQRKGEVAFFTKNKKVIPYEPDRAPRLSRETSPTKSNLTFTGQMLDSIDVITAKQGEVLVGPSGERDDGKSNQEIAGYVAEAGRPFNHLSDIETKRMTELISDKINELVKKVLTR